MAEFTKFNVTLLDATGETTTVSFPGDVIDEVNYEAQSALQAALLTQLQAITNGAVKKKQSVIGEEFVVNPPTDKTVQRESKVLAIYSDGITGATYHMEIGTFDHTVLPTAPTGGAVPESVDLTTGAGAAFKTAFENYVQRDGHAVLLTALRLMHRNT